MSNDLVERAAKTPISDLVKRFCDDLRAGYRYSGEAPNRMEHHNLGDETQAEILRQLEALKAKDAEIARLREALVWYEEKTHNCRKLVSEGDDARHALNNDGGSRARTALGGSHE